MNFESEMSKEAMIKFIKDNINQFNKKEVHGKFWGKIDSSIVTINKEICVELLRKSGYDFDSIKKDWAVNGFLIKNASGKFSHHVKILGIQGNYVKLNLGKRNENRLTQFQALQNDLLNTQKQLNDYKELNLKYCIRIKELENNVNILNDSIESLSNAIKSLSSLSNLKKIKNNLIQQSLDLNSN